MQKQQPLKLLFIINPVSGGKEKTDWEEKIRSFFKTSHHNMEFFLLTGKHDPISVKHHIETIKPDRVVAVGGDGTVKLVAEIVKDFHIPFAIIPAGSANGMARELNIPVDVDESLDIAVNGDIKTIDAVLINDQEICIHLSDMGLNAMLVKYFEGSPKRGMWGYGKAVFRVLWNKQKMHVGIKTDAEAVERNAFMVVIANARKYGTGANINPDGDLSDGYFEVVVVRKLNLIEIFKAIFTDMSFHSNRIEVFSARHAEIEVKHRTFFQVDGEYRGKQKKIIARILRGALKVMVAPDEKTA